jgi:transposase
MLNMEGWWVINDLEREGKNISAISRATGHDRKTIRKYINTDGLPKYKPRAKGSSLLDSYKDLIKELLKQDLMGTRIFREIQKKGYTGGYWILKEFIRPHRTEKAVEAVYRYETKPGVQAQVDFDPIGYIEVDGELKKLYCFNYILGFSRNRYTQFTVGAKTVDLLRLLMEAFQFFDGHTDEILFDNMKIIVIKRTLRYEDIDWNPIFEDFFRHFGFTPRLCKPGRAQTKGKVENQVKLVQNDFFKGQQFSGLSDLNSKAIGWCNEVNGRVHRTTGTIPRDRLTEEKLTPLAGKPPYQIVTIVYRKISRDCFIEYLGNRYSVPWQQAGRQARLLIKEGKLTIEVAGEKVCEHELKVGSGNVVRDKRHFDGLLSRIRGQNIRSHMQRVLKLPGMPDVERRPLSVYEDMCNNGGRIDG